LQSSAGPQIQLTLTDGRPAAAALPTARPNALPEATFKNDEDFPLDDTIDLGRIPIPPNPLPPAGLVQPPPPPPFGAFFPPIIQNFPLGLPPPPPVLPLPFPRAPVPLGVAAAPAWMPATGTRSLHSGVHAPGPMLLIGPHGPLPVSMDAPQRRSVPQPHSARHWSREVPAVTPVQTAELIPAESKPPVALPPLVPTELFSDTEAPPTDSGSVLKLVDYDDVDAASDSAVQR
jgi:hypothetical protein